MGTVVNKPRSVYDKMSEAVYVAELAGAGLTVYLLRGQYHLISTRKEHRIPALAQIVYHTHGEPAKVFHYQEGNGIIREEHTDANQRIVIRVRRYRSQSKMGVGTKRRAASG